MSKLFLHGRNIFGRGGAGTTFTAPALPDVTIPPTTVTLSLVSNTDTTASFSYTAAGDFNVVSGYRLYREDVTNSIPAMLVAQSDINTLTISDTTARPNTEYNYTVRATNSSLEAVDSNAINLTTDADTTIPIITSFVLGTPPDDSLVMPVLQITASDNATAFDNLRWFWREDDTTIGTPTWSPLPASITASTAAAHTITLWCIDEGDNVSEGYNSNAVTPTATGSAQGIYFINPAAADGTYFINPNSNPTDPIQIIPVPVTDLIASLVTPTTIAITYAEPINISTQLSIDFEVAYDGGGYALVETLPVRNAQPYIYTATSGHTYIFRMRTYNGTSYSLFTYSNLVTTPADTYLPTPTGVTAQATSSYTATVFVPVPTVTGTISEYRAYISTQPTVVVGSALLSTVSNSVVQIYVSGLSPDTDYAFVVAPSDGTNVGVQSVVTNTIHTAVLVVGDGTQLPTGNFTPRRMDMTVVYPRPDTEVYSGARHRWASTDFDYNVCVAIQGGSRPLIYSLSGPTGMTIGETYGTTEAPNPYYGIIRCSAANVALWSSGAQPVTVTVRGQDGEVKYITFSVTRDNSRFMFLNKDSGSGGNAGTKLSPKNDLSDVFTQVGKIIVLQNATASYTLQATWNINTATTPVSVITQEYSSTAKINMHYTKSRFVIGNSDFYTNGINYVGIMIQETTSPNDFQRIFETNSHRSSIQRCTFSGLVYEGQAGGDGNHAIFVTRNYSCSGWQHNSMIRNTFDGMPMRFGAFINYSHRYFVFELNTVKNHRSAAMDPTDPRGGVNAAVFPKGRCRYSTIAMNDMWTSNYGALIKIYSGIDGNNDTTTPADCFSHHEEVCWNKIRVIGNAHEGLVTHASSATGHAYSTNVYRNTLLTESQCKVNISGATTDAVFVQDNVALTSNSGITKNYGTWDKSNNSEGAYSGQNTVDPNTGLLYSSTYRGKRGHEVNFTA